jgi:hypothetical protein
MTNDIIPAGDRGSFTITDAQLMEQSSLSMEAFGILVEAEAERRGLELAVSEDVVSRAVTVAWRPGH